MRRKCYTNKHLNAINRQNKAIEKIIINGEDCFKIPLTKNLFSIISSEDIELVKKFKWFAKVGGSTPYARANTLSIEHPQGKRFNFCIHQLIMNRKGIDHINGDGLDNRRSNLRLATRSENSMNKSKSKKNKSSKFKGVTFNKRDNVWVTYITYKKKTIFLGNFKKEIDAGKAYDVKAKELCGAYAKLNLPEASLNG